MNDTGGIGYGARGTDIACLCYALTSPKVFHTQDLHHNDFLFLTNQKPKQEIEQTQESDKHAP